MANRAFRKAKGFLDNGIVMLSGQINIAADASISSCTIPGGTATKTGTGEYTFTLTDPYYKASACLATFQAATAVNLDAQVKSFDPTAAAQTAVIRTHASGTATDPSAVCAINVWLVPKDSSV